MLQMLFSRLHIRLLILILIAVAPAFGIVIYTSVEQRTSVQFAAQQRAQGSARELAARARDFVTHTQKLLASVARSDYVRAGPVGARCNDFLAEIGIVQQDYAELLVLAPDGAVRCSVNPAPAALNLAARPYFASARASADFAIGQLEPGPTSGRPVIMFAQPVFDAGGKLQAMVAAGLDPHQFDLYLADLPLPAGSRLTVADGNGTVLAALPGPGAGFGQPIGQLAQFMAFVGGARPAPMAAPWLDSAQRVSALVSLFRGGAADIYLRVDIPAESAYGDLGHIQRRNLFLLSAAALLTLALGWFFSKRLVLLRVDDLLATAKRLGAGELDARTRLAPDRSELGELARTLDEMAAAIERQQARVEQVERELRRSNRALHAIRDCETVIAEAADEEALLQGICDVVAATGYRMAWAGIVQSDGSGAIVPAGITGEHQDYVECIGQPLRAGLQGAGTIGEALRTRRPVVANRFRDDARLSDWREQALKRGFNSKIALPLLQGEAAIGVLNVYAFEQDAFDAKEVDLLIGLAQGVTVAIESHRQRSARQTAEAALHLRNRAIEASNNGMLIVECGASARIINVNAALMELVGGPQQDFLGQDLARLGERGFDAGGWHQLSELIRSMREDRLELSLAANNGHNGEKRWFDVSVAFVADETGMPRHAAAEFRDVTESRQYRQQIEHQANYDFLTELPNWNLLRDRLQQALEQAARAANPVCVLWLDLDRFHVINDTLGRAAADQVLHAVAQRLVARAGPGLTVARAESDEFVLIADAGSHQAIISLAGRIEQAIREPMQVAGQELILTASIGIAVAPGDGTQVETLLRNASIAMYRAKETERGSFCFYAEDMNASAMPRLRMEVSLRQAIERGELFLVYQPKVDLRSGAITGAEALIRWQHPQLGLISPVEFIPIAEESGLILPIGQWVLETACAQISQWQQEGLACRTIAVNVSPIQFFRSDVVGAVRELLAKYRLDPQLLMIEITESTLMRDTDHAVAMMQQLKSLGIKLAIDDFGTGFSSLSALKRFPIDYLKIDQSFVAGLSVDASDAAIALAVISLAHNLGLRVIAEGVETQAQLDYLRARDCDEMQGYYFSRPIPSAQMAALLRGDGVVALDAVAVISM